MSYFINPTTQKRLPSCGMVLTCLNTFVILLAQSVCYYHSVLLHYGFCKSSPGSSSLPRWVSPSQKTSITTSHVSLCIPWTAPSQLRSCPSWRFQIFRDIQHICDFHPSLGKANNPEVEHRGRATNTSQIRLHVIRFEAESPTSHKQAAGPTWHHGGISLGCRDKSCKWVWWHCFAQRVGQQTICGWCFLLLASGFPRQLLFCRDAKRGVCRPSVSHLANSDAIGLNCCWEHFVSFLFM